MAELLLVRFNLADEFCAELLQRGPDVEPLVRLTRRTTRTDQLPVTHLTVVAGYVRHVANALCGEGHLEIVRLETYCGQVWPGRGDETGATAHAERVIDQVTALARKLDLTIAAGVYEAPGEEVRRG